MRRFHSTGPIEHVRPVLFVLFLVLCGHSKAQHWLDKLAGGQADHVADLVVDASGSIYVIGDLSQVMTVSSGINTMGTITSSGGRDAFVAKFTGEGELVWTRRAGGGGVDVGLKLVLGPGGLGVTGIFTGTADVFGTVMTAQGGSTDMFVAMLDPADGTTEWVRSAGSAGYTDTPGGIASNSTGDLVVAGKFKGTAIFGTDTLHSAFDPWTMGLGFDVFIASWAADGTYQWVKQGSGPHDDEAVDLVSGPDDMLYVTGQFSDTITFDVMHPNISLNSMFVVKFDADGNEQWFRKCGGSTYNRVSDIRWSGDGDLLLTGDVANTMFWVANVATPIPNTDPFAYFILRVDEDGGLIGSTTLGSASPVHAASITEQGDSVIVYGEFQCSFTGLQDAYSANGLFMATGLKDLFITKHLASDLSFVEAQQFGGEGAKRAGAVASLQGELLFAGSFDGSLFLPGGSVQWGDPVNFLPFCSYTGVNGGLNYCGDPDYGRFAWAEGVGLADGFLTKGYVESRQPYDFWNRQGTAPCDRVDRSAALCINAQGLQCPDSVAACGSVDLYAVVPFAHRDDLYCPGGRTVGPAAYPTWDTGWPSGQTTASATGWYSYAVYPFNGCYSWRDSIHVTIHPTPTSRVTDSSGVFVDSWLPQVYQSCDPLLIWATQFAPTDEVYWTVGTDTTWSDTIRTIVSAVYRLHVVSANGCSTTYSMNFGLLAPPPFPNITAVDAVFLQGDTTSTCSATCAGGSVVITWYVDGVPTPLPIGLKLTYQFAQSCNSQSPPTTTGLINNPVAFSIPINGPGWYPVEATFTLNDLPCDTNTYTFTFADSIYVLPGLPPVITSGPTFHCAGDTVPINFQCTGCDSVSWSGPGIVWMSSTGDSVRVDQNGYYYFSYYHTEYGNTCTWNSYLSVFAPPPPPIFSSPSNGIICPNDSVLLYTYGNYSGFEWSGPGAITLPVNDSIWVDEPGDYYLSVTLYPGCVSTNGPRSVLNFSSPFIEALPTGTICANGSVDLHVVSGTGSTVQWQAPLSGTSSQQTVTQAGIYHCLVSSCGIDWDLSYTVVATGVNAELDTTNYVLCENSPLVLTGPPGGDIYQWSPSGQSGQTLTVTAPGTYQLVVIDAFGCSDTSSFITVEEHLITQPATATGDTACFGMELFISATGSGELFWYADPDASDLLGMGPLLVVTAITSDTVFLLQVEEGCPGLIVPVPVQVLPVPDTPVILGSGSYCEGDPIELTSTGSGAISWSTPLGSFEGPGIGPFIAGPDAEGAYASYINGPFCNSDTAVLMIDVHPVPTAPGVTGESVFCIGDSIMLFATDISGTAYWATPGGSVIGDAVIIASAELSDAGAYSCYIALGQCVGDTTLVLVQVSDCPVDDEPVIPNIFTPNGDGVNDTFTITGGLQHLELNIYNRWGQLVAVRSGRYVSWDGRSTYSGEPCPDGVYFYVIEAITKAGDPYQRSGYLHLQR
ncbi:MAG: gliding motility-associated C-terminal domain-containing protein [Flavobacteriales bacterium]